MIIVQSWVSAGGVRSADDLLGRKYSKRINKYEYCLVSSVKRYAFPKQVSLIVVSDFITLKIQIFRGK
jgi:hypothetical protein